MMEMFVGVVQERWVRLADVGEQGGCSGIRQAHVAVPMARHYAAELPAPGRSDYSRRVRLGTRCLGTTASAKVRSVGRECRLQATSRHIPLAIENNS
jgi:hypothetical protein